MFASDIAPGRRATEAALTAKTSQTIARLLGAHHDKDDADQGDSDHMACHEHDHASGPSHQHYTHVQPPHTRPQRHKPENGQLSPLASENFDAIALSPPRAGASVLPANVDVDSDPRFDESRWDNEFLAPLLPVQVSILLDVLWLDCG